MQQLKTIEKLKTVFPSIEGIEVALLYGSCARREQSPNSDIDIQIIATKEFALEKLEESIGITFKDEVQYSLGVKLRNKLVFYFKSQPKLEISVWERLDDIKRNYLGSEISDCSSSILYERNSEKTQIESYLLEITKNKSFDEDKQITDLIDRFLYEFENCSTMHRRSDTYQFYYFYNIALHVAVQLNCLSRGKTKFNFLPKYFLVDMNKDNRTKEFHTLNGTLYLPKANERKRKLLDFFYTTLKELIPKEKVEEIIQFCEWIYTRDFFWNFRDISKYNNKIKSNHIFRTATLSIFQKEERLTRLLSDLNIKTIIDLRANKEIAEQTPYEKSVLEKINYVKTPFDPWNQSEWFKKNHYNGTNEEIAYNFFAIGCNEQIKVALETIINERNGAVAIHCFAGKDRTGIFISLLHLLIDTPMDIIYNDYFASEVDVKKERLDLVLNVVRQKGGIVPYLMGCGLSRNQIDKLKNKLIYGN